MNSRFALHRWASLAANWLWSWMRRPWLAIFAGLIGATLALAVWQLPQLPGQFVDEHAAAATWLLNTSARYGIWGSALLALGLFDVLRSPLVYLLLALLLPTLATQLADQLGALRQYRAAQRLDLHQPLITPGQVLHLSAARHLYRDRTIVPQTVEPVADLLRNEIAKSYPHLEVARLEHEDEATETAPAIRMRGLRYPRLQNLRPLLMVGLLTAVCGAWIALAFGWQVTAPPLAPGATYRSANRDLMLHYALPITGTEELALSATLQGTRVELPAEDAARRPLGTATLQSRPAYPAILVATTDGIARLNLPGDSTPRAQVGLVFADPGSEESVLIPDQGIGLRVVQRAGSEGFVLELYRSDTIQPVYRADLTPGGQLTVPFGPLDPGLIITAMPGLQVDVRHLPGLLLVPLGLLVALIGTLAFQRPSAFVIAQVEAWATGYAVVVLQADHEATVIELRRLLASLPANPQTDLAADMESTS